ncbi:MAG: response regulator [Planctomycetota bacterium]
MSMAKEPWRLLVADDSLMTQRILTQTAARYGFEVVGVASDGREAIQRWGELRPDAVVLDIVMPEIDGIGVLEAILDQDRDARVVMLSSLHTRKDVLECRSHGAKGYILKPFEPGHVFEILRGLLETVRSD